MTTTLTLTADPNGTPAPFVTVAAGGFEAGTATVTVWRTVNGRQFKVRGLVNVSAGGTASARDFEAPFNVESSYRVQRFDSDGDFLGWSDSETVTLSGPEGYFWVHNPLDPAGSVRVLALAQAAAILGRPIAAEVFRVQGRSAGVALFDTRHAVEQVNLGCLTESLADSVAFDLLFGGYDDASTVPIICVRQTSAMGLPPTLFALVVNPQRLTPPEFNGGEIFEWALIGDEISPPPEAIIVQLLGYDDFTAFYSDYAAFTAAYVDYAEAQQDYSIAGTA